MHLAPPNVCSEDLIRQVKSLRAEIEQQSALAHPALLELPPDRRSSAENLLHYLVLRSHDLRPLQDRLARLGLSSLGRAEPHVLATIEAVLHNLYLLGANELAGNGSLDIQAAFDPGAGLLEQNTIRCLGPYPKNRRVHIVVTMPSEAADDYMLVHRLLESGMDCMRINCAHDDHPAWSRMIGHLRYAERATGRSCRILMDLDGPKLRTGPMKTVPAVLKIKPARSAAGQVLRPASIWLSPSETSRHDESSDTANLTLSPGWLGQLAEGDTIRFHDARGSKRTWLVREATSEGCRAEANKTAYLANGTRLYLQGHGGHHQSTVIDSLPLEESVIHLRTGDVLLLSGGEKPGRPAIHDENGNLLSPGRVSLCIPEIYRDARPGEPVYFDDGRIGGIIEKLDEERLQVRITHTRKPVEKLASGKGINLPDTRLRIPVLGPRDLEDLEFATEHADMVGLSFVNSPDDVRTLRGHMQELGCENVAAVLKIETKRGFTNLPEILLEALRFPACGVMIARGDLAVECGFERLAEIQEEILWVCEAAHIPVIWATQVLEGLIKQGQVARAEITDAAMAQAAEAVLLNKGPHITEAVRVLDDILQRMQGHHCKKRSMLRKLHLAVDTVRTRN